MAHPTHVRGFALAALLLAPLAVAGQTLCAKGETDYFSCEVGGDRIVSVCGQVHESPTAEDWLQVRFGRTGGLEMGWPAHRRDSLGKFEGNVFGPYAVSDLRFLAGGASYGISLSRGGEDDGAGGRTRPAAGMSVTRAGHADVRYECTSPDTARYGSSFEALNALLANGHGKSERH